MHNEADKLQLVNVQQKFYTLIPSRFPPIGLFDRLTELNQDAIATIEEMTNPRIRERNRLLNDVNTPDALSPHLQNWNHAPFAYPNPEGTRFFDHNVPALELSDTLQTALAVSVKKRERFLARTDEDPLDLDMRELTRVVKGQFVDGRNWDLNLSQDDRLRLGRAVLDIKADGIIFRCSDRPSATCISIINGQTLERAVQGDHFRFVWDGRSIKTLYSFRDGDVIRPDQLALPDKVLAA